MNVPRPASWPVIRMAYPEETKVAKARCSPIPQSRFTSPRPIAARSASTFSTSGWALKCSGNVVIRSDKRFSSVIGTEVSAASVHLRLRKGIQSTAYLFLKLEITGSIELRPASIASRNALTIVSPPSAAIVPCVDNLSA